MTYPTRRGMSAEQARPGTRVRVMEHHMVEQRRDLLLVGTVVARYGVAEDYMALDVRLDGGRCRLFWPSRIVAPTPSGYEKETYEVLVSYPKGLAYRRHAPYLRPG